MRLWAGLSVEILADLIQELPRHFYYFFNRDNKKQNQRPTPLQTNVVDRSLRTSAASIPSLTKFPSSSSFSAIIQNCQIS